MRIILGITGGIAAYKSAELIRRWVKEGDEVKVIMTRNATHFITPMTVSVLSGNPVFINLFSEREHESVDHVDLTKWSDILVVAPATANILANFAHGIADDFLSTYHLAHIKPVLVAPAMNVNMWNHPAVGENLTTLRGRGVHVVEPEAGELACGDEGTGRLADLEKIFEASKRYGNPSPHFKGKRVLITAGSTREHLDPVRYLSNPSKGKMGIELARHACREGAEVTLVMGPTSEKPPFGPRTIRITSVGEMEEAVFTEAESAHILIMAAAVGDFTPETVREEKIRRSGESLSLSFKPTGDILAGVLKKNPNLLSVGFAAELEPDEGTVREKMARKGVDLIVVNDVSRKDIGFAADDNQVTLYSKEGLVKELVKASKGEIAREIIRVIADLCHG